MPGRRTNASGGPARLSGAKTRLQQGTDEAPPIPRLRLNMAINLVSAAVPLVVMVVTVPLYMRHVGDARYGVLLIAWTLLGYLGFLDFGMARATTNALARQPLQAFAQRERIVWSSLVFNAILGAAGWLVLLAIGALLFTHLLTPPPSLTEEMAGAIYWLAPMLPIAMLTGIGTGVLEARERFAVVSVIQTTAIVAGQALTLVAAIVIGPSLLVILPVMLAVRAAGGLATLFAAWRAEGLGLVPRPDLTTLKELGSFGGWVTVTNVVGPILTTVDQLLIGAMRGAAAVPQYAIPMNILGRSMIVPSVAMRTLFPAMSRADPRALARTSTQACNAIGVFMTPIAIVAWLLSDIALELWLGGPFASKAAPVFKVLSLGFWLNGLGYVAYTALQASSRARVVALTHLAELPIYAGLLVAGIYLAGTLGVAWAWTLRVLLDDVLLLGFLRLKWRELTPVAVSGTIVAMSVAGDILLVASPMVRLGATFALAALLALTTLSTWLPFVRPAYRGAI